MAVNSTEGDLSNVITNLDSMFQNYGTVALIFAGVGGVVLAGYAGMKLHSTLMEDSHAMMQSRGSVAGCLLAIVIGGLITISSVIVTWFGLLYG
ncbi:hypothetical protein RMS29_027515 (plasmid) [Agrobacterium rosae]|uniref:Sodium-translocating pyrophosphatase n=1 Tax=Agrobacterium rosae TaxID=1972867 RepID=A0AAW9FH12_9HYPH|nr:MULTISPECIES: hypothetical protein [Agrobacterium]MCF1501578.1 hypothetical protein [Allorhizobium sp. Av2]MDX8321702.1 hypothetical protein [Agrobacterium sp. rho-8.1]MDX8305165.1 hypothetical protein [Agrobacterium rosae]MDX8311449.1 hypothetical protein [Agrobacterium sp. rho-13.3]MDX8316319.1 hypothetical protein [Agrobacterium rosae]